jgi:hypothetical protein
MSPPRIASSTPAQPSGTTGTPRSGARADPQKARVEWPHPVPTSVASVLLKNQHAVAGAHCIGHPLTVIGMHPPAR